MALGVEISRERARDSSGLRSYWKADSEWIRTRSWVYLETMVEMVYHHL